jgi:hypothetical protein
MHELSWAKQGNSAFTRRTNWSQPPGVLTYRRLSNTFFGEEREKLQRYRRDVRRVQGGQPIRSDLVPNPDAVPSRLYDGQRVMAIHPMTREIQPGIIIGATVIQQPSNGTNNITTSSTTTSGSNSHSHSHSHIHSHGGMVGVPHNPMYMYRVNFGDQYGIKLVMDTDCTLDITHRTPSLFGGVIDHHGQVPFPHASDDYPLVVTLLKLLDKKVIHYIRITNVLILILE